MNYTLHHGDCLEIMPTLEARSVDMILADTPYGTTACPWDSVIPFAPMWECIKHVIKPRGAVVLFGSQPFTSALVMSNPQWFKYCWVWDKAQAGNFLSSRYQPLKVTEDICVFSRETTSYYPQMTKGKYRKRGGAKTNMQTTHGYNHEYTSWSDEYCPTNLLRYPNCASKSDNIHPTQKSVDLLAYLIETYTTPDETVLDFTFGSCSTGIACIETGRNFVGIEKDPEYFMIGEERMAAAYRRANGEALKGKPTDIENLPLFA